VLRLCEETAPLANEAVGALATAIGGARANVAFPPSEWTFLLFQDGAAALMLPKLRARTSWLFPAEDELHWSRSGQQHIAD